MLPWYTCENKKAFAKKTGLNFLKGAYQEMIKQDLSLTRRRGGHHDTIT